MAVKVLIERWVKSGQDEAVWNLLRDLRSEAVRQRGYLYGETWHSVDKPGVYIIVSTWGAVEYWQSWADDPFRIKIDERLKPLLKKPTEIRVFEEMTTPAMGASKQVQDDETSHW